MPICFHRDSSGYDLLKSARLSSAKPSVEFRPSAANCLDIGLVNNMPGKALRATERQFLTLLHSASRDVVVRLWLYALPDVPRSDAGRRRIDSFYSSIDDLWDRPLDGLIVTGMEPRASNLKDEPHWASMTRLIDWAERNTCSTIWSCLAAHAALLHTDGIERRRLHEKRFGLFECDRASEHQLLDGVPSPVSLPHSRWHDVPEDALAANGYSVLTRAGDFGVDAFVKQRQSLFVFFQGHPEYEADTLQLEYVRDAGRYIHRESDHYPDLPHAYFDRATADSLIALQAKAVLDPREELLSDITNVLTAGCRSNQWRPSAIRMYGNWLQLLSAAKPQRLGVRSDREAPVKQVIASAS